MSELVEVQLARIEERIKNLDEKVDAIAVNQKDFSRVAQEFHTFKGQVMVWGSVFVIAFNFLKDSIKSLVVGK